MAFEIGPRTNEKDDWFGDQPAMAAHRSEVHVRVINGTEYLFGRNTYENGAVTLTAMKRGAREAAHWFTSPSYVEPRGA
ncbi:hypothetical protein [Streptomyces pseudovenezuelae]|uniref:hypothetical protein n=1 Tax=Streptomyces pseudovenezuelae TaxID=67350 RepID=UPI002E2F5CC9|nr:hypothetical protein [Streptomyces pseudovenezuelae]